MEYGTKLNMCSHLCLCCIVPIPTSLLSTQFVIPEKDYHATPRLQQFKAVNTALACYSCTKGGGQILIIRAQILLEVSSLNGFSFILPRSQDRGR